MYSPGWTPPGIGEQRRADRRGPDVQDVGLRQALLDRHELRGRIGLVRDEDEPGVGRSVGGDAVVVVVRPAQDPLARAPGRGPTACARSAGSRGTRSRRRPRSPVR